MYISTIADQALYILGNNRACRTVLLDTDELTWAELCRIGVRHNLKTIWITPGTEISDRVWHDERSFSGMNDSKFDIGIQREKRSQIPRFVSIKRIDGTWDEKRLIYVGIPEHDSRWSEDGVDAWALADCEDPKVLLGAFCYLKELGLDVEFSPGYSSIELMKDTTRKHPQWMRLSDMSAVPWYAESDILWYRPLTAAERRKKYLHFHDGNSKYLAAATGAEIGEAEPEEVAGNRFDKKLCGVWELNIRRSPSTEMFPAAISGNLAVTPVVDLLPQLGYEFEIKRGWIWEKHHRTLHDWAKQLWDSRLALKFDTDRFPNGESRETAYKMIKIMATRGLGWLDIAKERGKKTDNPWHRPDAKNQVVGLSRVRMLLKIMQIRQQHDMLPCAVYTDAGGYCSDEPNPALAVPALTHRRNQQGELRENKNELGGFKHVRTVPITPELIELFDSGVEPAILMRKVKALAGGGEF